MVFTDYKSDVQNLRITNPQGREKIKNKIINMSSSKIVKHTDSADFELSSSKSFEVLLSDVRQIIESGLQQAYQSVNMVMLNTYWNVGKRIIEDE